MQLTQFEELKKIAQSFGFSGVSQVEAQMFIESGIKTNLSDVFELNEELVTVLKNGTIKKTMAYISDINSEYIEKYGSYPQYHIFNCSILKYLKKQNKEHKYRKTLRSDGSFTMTIKNEKSKLNTFSKVLEICEKCLDIYNSRYKSRCTQNNFNIKEYVKRPILNKRFYGISYMYFDDDLETVPRFYSKSWKNIADELKSMNNYTCQKCGINLYNNREYLHVHHIKSTPNSAIISYLIVLCIECHSQEDSHEHILLDTKYETFINKKNKKSRINT